MKITFTERAGKADALVVLVPQGGKTAHPDRGVQEAVRRAVAAGPFEGKAGQVLGVPGPAGMGYRHLLIVGAGKPAELKTADFEKIGGAVLSALNARRVVTATVACDMPGAKTGSVAARIALGALLSSYRFDKYLTKEPQDKKPSVRDLSFAGAGAARAKADFGLFEKQARAVFLTRDLVSEAPNALYPESFARIIQKELAPLGVRVRVLGVPEMKRLGMGALIAVGQGSAQPPRLVTLEYMKGPRGQKPTAFVGKGVTFDTGGISLKPGPGMEEMKFDMAGAAAVVGLFKSLAARKAKANVVGVVALAENMPSGNACRPGDIVTSMSGQTIQIDNTDAEGRLILCDALWYCQEKFKPTRIVDLATLTGAIIVALGHEYAGCFANDDKLAESLVAAGAAVGEPLWRMPLNDAWDKEIDCPAADMKNMGSGKGAGSAIGAHFLARYIQKGVKWAHLDIAGTAWSYKDRTGVPKGASGFGVRLLDSFVAETCEK